MSPSAAWKILLTTATILATLTGLSPGFVSAQDADAAPREPASGDEQQAEEEEGFVPLFDGRLLTGWEGNARWFRIVDSAIVAGTLEESIPHNYFLCTTKKFGDFELRLDVKAVGEAANGGIQIRSRRVPDSEEVEGYQADVGGVRERMVWGGLYDESRRRKFLAEPDQEKLKELVRDEDWNSYRIRCVGPKVELFLNGEQTVDYTETDDSIPQTGIIGLQIHSGPPAEVWYRNIRIKPL